MKKLIFLLIFAGCAEMDNKKCAEYGFTPGTRDFASCRLELDQARDESYDNLNRGLIQHNQNMAAETNRQAEQLQYQWNQSQQRPPQRTPVTTNCYRNGSYTNCSSY